MIQSRYEDQGLSFQETLPCEAWAAIQEAILAATLEFATDAAPGGCQHGWDKPLPYLLQRRHQRPHDQDQGARVATLQEALHPTEAQDVHRRALWR